MFFLLFALFFANLRDNSTVTATPWPTSVSGVPSWTEVFLTCGIAILIVLVTVLVLCFKKTSNAQVVRMNQALIQKADV